MAGGTGKFNEGLVASLEQSVAGVRTGLGASRRHCWVVGAADDPGPHPALLVGWQRRGGQWFGRAIYYSEVDDVVIQQWLPASMLTPIGPR